MFNLIILIFAIIGSTLGIIDICKNEERGNYYDRCD